MSEKRICCVLKRNARKEVTDRMCYLRNGEDDGELLFVSVMISAILFLLLARLIHKC